MKKHIVEYDIECFGNLNKTFREYKTKTGAKSAARALAKKHKIFNVIYKEVKITEMIKYSGEWDHNVLEDQNSIWKPKEHKCIV